jgi:hypothetical protein
MSQFVRSGSVNVYPMGAQETLLCVWREGETNQAVVQYANAVHRAYREMTESGELRDGMESVS